MWSKKSWNGSSGPFPLSSLAFLGLGREWTLPRPGPNLWEAHSPVNAFTHRCTYKYTQIGKEGRGGENFENGIEKYPIPKEFKKANCLRRNADNVDPALARPISQYRAPIPHFVQLWVERQRVVLSQKCIKMHKNANIGFICILMYATVQHYRPTGSSFHGFLYCGIFGKLPWRR